MGVESDLEALFRKVSAKYDIELEKGDGATSSADDDDAGISLYGQHLGRTLHYQRKEDMAAPEGDYTEVGSFEEKSKVLVSGGVEEGERDLGYVVQVQVPEITHIEEIGRLVGAERGRNSELISEIKEGIVQRMSAGVDETQPGDTTYINIRTQVSDLDGVEELIYALLD